jgi:hypothetical protein
MKMRALAPLLVICALAMTGPSWGAQDDPVIAALQDELQRSMSTLRLEGQPAPYYIAYQLDDISSRALTARLGEIANDNPGHSRVLSVEVRVGDYDFDSSRFNSPGSLATGTAVAALDDDYDALRRQLWLLTDASYKGALKLFASKKAAFQNRKADEVIPDFSRASPVQKVLAPLPASPASVWSDWTERARQLSGVFLSNPDIQTSEVNVVEERGRRYYVNSEGFRIVTPISVSGMRVLADTQAADGTPVRDNFEILERSLQDLPATAELLARTREFAARMTAVRTASMGDEYTGPVLFEARAGAELARQVLVPALLAVRSQDSERATQGTQPQFLSRIGTRVMAEELSVTDTPSLARFGARPVGGAYELDDEGVPAQDVPLVEQGKLRTLLTNRVPLRGLLQSNGHGRGGTVQPGVVQISSSAAVPFAQLKATYLELLKKEGRAFGYIVRSLASLQVVKVTPDGAEEPVRGVRFGSLATNMFRDVLGASTERELVTWRIRQALASVIAPGFIIDDLEIQRLRDVAQKPPVVPSPLLR